MPLYKKQPFALAEKPNDLNPNEHVFQVRFTNELFRDYSEYQKRIKLYRRRVWTSKSSGKTNLTYEEALVSENKAAEKVKQFPKEFAASILREVQFSMLPLRVLVNSIFEKFQGPFSEGNELYARKNNRVNPCKIVKVLEGDDKTEYEVLWLGKEKQVTGNSLIKGEDLIEKLPFSKEVLKSFVRESTYRYSPWVLHDNLAKSHGISSHPPVGVGVNLSISIQNGLVVCSRKRKKAEDEKTLPGQSQTTAEVCSRKRKKTEDEKTLPGQSQTTLEEDVIKKMPTHKRVHQDANDYHLKASNDIPHPKKLRKKEVEKSSDGQKEPLENPIEKFQASNDIPHPKKLQKKAVEKSSDGQKEPLEDPVEKFQASNDIPNPKKLRKNAVEKSSDGQKEPSDPIAETLCQRRFVPVKKTENFSKLPYELLGEIAKQLKLLEDFTCFRSVSRSLHLSVEEEYFEGLRFRKSLPYLMLPPVSRRDGNDDIRQFHSLIEGESIVASLEVPAFKTKFFFESLGWLLTIDVDGSMSLLDPFSGTEIPVPHLHTFPGLEQLTMDKRYLVKKMVLSSRPNETSDFILMVIIGYIPHLAFWRLGDKAWNKIDTGKGWFWDIVYVGGEQFYASGGLGIIWLINLTAGHVECRIIIERIYDLRVTNCQGQYIVKSTNGPLLGIKRTKEYKYYLTNEFKVYDIDIATGTWVRIYSMGRMAVFLGRNSSFVVDATTSGGVIKANHIYFTDDFMDYQHSYFTGDDWRAFSGGSSYALGGSVDSGVFDLETGDIVPIYPVEPLVSNVCPAMWITPNLCFK